MAETFTPTLNLSKFSQGEKPPVLTAAKLNANWTAIDSAIASLASSLALKGSQAELDTVIEDLETLSAAILAAAYIKADGSVPMAADLDVDTSKVVNLGNGVDPADAVNRGQLDAAIAAGLGGLAGSYAYCLAKNSADLDNAATGETSPKTFKANTNVVITNGDMHDTGAPTLFVAPQDGFYLFIARMKVTGAGGATLTWWKNGAEAAPSIQPPVLHDVGEDTTFITDTLLIQLEEDDEVTLKVYGLTSQDGVIKADSTIAMFLLAANAVGGGDLKSDGSIPMVNDFDNGGNKQINLADGVAADDGATVGQVATITDDLQEQIDDLVVTGAQLVTLENELADGGSFGFIGTGWTLVTSSEIVFTIAAQKKVAVDAEATALTDFVHRSNAQLGIRVQKTGDAAVDYPGTLLSSGPLGNRMLGPVTAKKKLTLGAGEWTVSMIARQVLALGASTAISKDPGSPARLSVLYTE